MSADEICGLYPISLGVPQKGRSTAFISLCERGGAHGQNTSFFVAVFRPRSATRSQREDTGVRPHADPHNYFDLPLVTKFAGDCLRKYLHSALVLKVRD